MRAGTWLRGSGALQRRLCTARRFVDARQVSVLARVRRVPERGPRLWEAVEVYMRAFAVSALAVLFTVASAALSAADAPQSTRIGEYTFSLDGKPFAPEFAYLYGEPGKPQPGDLFRCGVFWIPLDEQAELQLKSVDEGDAGTNFKVRRGDRWVWLAVVSGRLRILPDRDLGTLLAVRANSGEPSAWSRLEQLDATRVSMSAQIQKDPARLPVQTRYLTVRGNAEALELVLMQLSALELLDIEALRREDIDLRALEGATGLRFLKEAVGYRQASSWWEEDRVRDRLRAMLLENEAPGAEFLRAAEDLAALGVWFEMHGEAYLAHIPKKP